MAYDTTGVWNERALSRAGLSGTALLTAAEKAFNHKGSLSIDVEKECCTEPREIALLRKKKQTIKSGVKITRLM